MVSCELVSSGGNRATDDDYLVRRVKKKKKKQARKFSDVACSGLLWPVATQKGRNK